MRSNMSMKLRSVIMALVLTAAGAGLVFANGTAFAENELSKGACGSGIDEDLRKAAGCEEKRSLPSVANTLINVVVAIVGVGAVIIIVVGGIRYALSLGDPGKIKEARHMIIYGIIGLLVAIMAWAIVNFIINIIPKEDGTPRS